MEDVVKYEADIAILKTEVRHINKHLAGIDESMKKLQELMFEQSDLRKDITEAIKEHTEMRKELSGFGKRVSDNEKEISIIKNEYENLPKNIKSNIFDYLWKYAAVAIGGWIALKIAGILPQ